jgi:hypothetical protein
MRRRVFLLSPASANGERAKMTLREAAAFDLAVRLRQQGAPIGEVFSFISGLYFRGKVVYCERFARPPADHPAALVITPDRGLVPLDAPMTIGDLRASAEVPIDLHEPRFLHPFERDAHLLAERTGAECDVVLLGSVATAKYVDPLLAIFGDRLLFPAAFAGRGDISRGGLMLRCARDGAELEYVAVRDAARHGPRPPKLARLW